MSGCTPNPTPGSFEDNGSSLVRIDDGRADISPGWVVGAAVNGGALMSLATRAALEATGAEQAHTDPVRATNMVRATTIPAAAATTMTMTMAMTMTMTMIMRRG